MAVSPSVARLLFLERFRRIWRKAPQLASAVNRFLVAMLSERVAEANAQTRAMQD